MRLALCLALCLVAGCIGPAQPGPGDADVAPGPDEELLAHLETLATFPELRFETDHGTIRMLLYADWTPQTVEHIGGLADDGFYDGTIIHRVVDDFVIQGGDPTGTGEGGSGPAGLSTDTVPLEIKEGLRFGSGAVGLARWTEDTGDSQWFITERPALHLNDPQGQPNELLGPYALFGQVFEGMDVVRSIASVETLPNDRPVEDVVLETAQRLGPPDADLFHLVVDVTEPFDAWSARGASLEMPRYTVVGHPMTIRLHALPPEDPAGGASPCPTGAADGNHLVAPDATGPTDPLVFAATEDPCTFALTLIPTAAGTWRFIGHDAPRDGVPTEVGFEVLPWHEAYAPFTGVAAA